MDVIFGNLDLWGTAIKNTLLVFFGGGALAPVVFGGVGDALGVSVAVMTNSGTGAARQAVQDTAYELIRQLKDIGNIGSSTEN